MNLNDAIRFVISPGLTLLPDSMDTPAARAMLLTIGLQESKFDHRRQSGGPAKGFFQFELSGVNGVLHHHSSKIFAMDVLKKLQYDLNARDAYDAIEHNDLLATAFARLLLWTLPVQLPGPNDYDHSWMQYVSAWRPGKPHRETWNAFYWQAWSEVMASTYGGH
ncbi:MAG: hypothetical protein WC455_19535 [Dehalococcoidia bacterium]